MPAWLDLGFAFRSFFWVPARPSSQPAGPPPPRTIQPAAFSIQPAGPPPLGPFRKPLVQNVLQTRRDEPFWQGVCARLLASGLNFAELCSIVFSAPRSCFLWREIELVYFCIWQELGHCAQNRPILSHFRTVLPSRKGLHTVQAPTPLLSIGPWGRTDGNGGAAPPPPAVLTDLHLLMCLLDAGVIDLARDVATICAAIARKDDSLLVRSPPPTCVFHVPMR